MKLISKIDAKKQGLPNYFTGMPCKRGHISERYLSGHCIKCSRFKENLRRLLLRETRPDEVRKKNALQYKKHATRQRNWEINDKKNNPEKYKLKDRNYYLNNVEKKKAYIKQWTQDNKAHVLAYNSNRRATIINRMPQWLSDDDKQCIKDIYKIAARVSRETGVPYQVDHIIPLCGTVVSGLHVPENLQLLTAFDNRSKYNHYLA